MATPYQYVKYLHDIKYLHGDCMWCLKIVMRYEYQYCHHSSRKFRLKWFKSYSIGKNNFVVFLSVIIGLKLSSFCLKVSTGLKDLYAFKSCKPAFELNCRRYSYVCMIVRCIFATVSCKLITHCDGSGIDNGRDSVMFEF